jgi:LuxR family transcriptional regulator, maltose regulon positive regulatory protein
LTALDSEQRWYSYHPLFSTFLRNRLAGVGLERRIALYQAAVRWFAQAGLLEEAIDHGLAGGLVDETVDLIERYGDGWLVRGELRTLRSWIDALPEALVRGRARLLLLQLCALMLDARWDCVEPLLIGLEARNDQTECVIVQALAALVGGQLVVAEAALDQARGRIHPDDRFLQTMLAMLDAAVCWVRGNETTAQALLATLPVPRLAGSGAQLALLAIAHQAHFDALAGRLEIAIVRYRQVCEQSRADDAGTNVGLGMALLGLAQIHYERNELVEALNAADLADEHAQRWGNQALQPPTALVRAQILIASGDLSATEDVVEHLERTVRGAPTLASALVCLALARAELALARDEAMIAASWLAGISRELAALPSGSLRERAQRLEVRALLERGETHAALASLQVLVEATQQRGRIASLVPLLALLACVYEALGQHQRASQLVLEAVQRGAVGPFVQSMISAGPLLHPLLAELPTGRREEIQYAGLVRVALAQQQLRRMHVHAIEPLSAREHEVLRLLADGATNREIAAQLLVTESTVKKHLSTIYQKFGVARRTQAILVAQARGLL